MDFMRKAALKQSVNQMGRQMGMSSNVTDSLPGGSGSGGGSGGGGGSGVAASISSAFGRGEAAPGGAPPPAAALADGWGASTGGETPPANYPPGLRLFYVDVSTLDTSPEVRKPLAYVHLLLAAGTGGLFLNFLTWVFRLIRGDGGRTWTLVLGSGFMAAAGSLAYVALYASAFRGAAAASVAVQSWALGGLALALIFAAVYAFGGVWVFNGWYRLHRVLDGESGARASRFSVVIESIWWTAVLLLTVYAGGEWWRFRSRTPTRVASTFARDRATSGLPPPPTGGGDTLEEIRARYGVAEV